MMLLVPVPWSRRVWALPFLTALCWPASKRGQRRHKTSIDWVRQMMKQVRRWLPGRRLVMVVDGGFAAVSLALACVKSRVTMVSRLRWDAALYHPPGPQPKGKRGPKPTKGKRQRSLQGWAERSDTPWETVEVDWYGGQRKKLWVFSRTALWYTPRLPPVAIRYVLVADPEGKLRMEAFFCTDLEATPVEILQWVVMRWSVEVTFEESPGASRLGDPTPVVGPGDRPHHPGPVGPVLARHRVGPAVEPWQADPGAGNGLVPQSEPTFADCLALVRRHLWRARYLVNSAPEAEFMQFPREAFDLLIMVSRWQLNWPKSSQTKVDYCL